MSEDTPEYDLGRFSDSEASEPEEKEEKPKRKRKTKRKTSKSKTTTKKALTASEQRRKLVEDFMKRTEGQSLSGRIAQFAREHKVPRILDSEIRNVSASRDPYRVLEYMCSKRR